MQRVSARIETPVDPNEKVKRSDEVPRRREPDEPPRHRIQILLPEELFEALRQAARVNNRSINGEVVTAVQDYLRRQHGQTQAPRDEPG